MRRLAGAVLIAEGSLWVVLRFLTVVYVVATQSNHSDELRTPGWELVLWLFPTFAVGALGVWTGVLLRRADPAWSSSRWPGRAALVVTGLANAGLAVLAVFGVVRGGGAEARVSWLIVAVGAAVVVAGLVKDAAAGSPGHEPGPPGSAC